MYLSPNTWGDAPCGEGVHVLSSFFYCDASLRGIFMGRVGGGWCDLTLPPHSGDSSNPPGVPADDHDSPSASLPARSHSVLFFFLPTYASIKSLFKFFNNQLSSLLSHRRVMSLTCKQMRFVNDLFYKRSSLWWFLYEHISGLASALLNHLHTGNWSWEYYSHVRPHYSVRKAWRHNWVRGTFKSSYSCMQGNPGFHNFMTTI